MDAAQSPLTVIAPVTVRLATIALGLAAALAAAMLLVTLDVIAWAGTDVLGLDDAWRRYALLAVMWNLVVAAASMALRTVTQRLG